MPLPEWLRRVGVIDPVMCWGLVVAWAVWLRAVAAVEQSVEIESALPR
jgi:hypothetical protein